MNRANGRSSVLSVSVASVIAATLMLTLLGVGIVPIATGAHAQDLKLIRISANRSVSAVALWGLNPFAKKYGLRVEVNATATNADMQRAAQSGDVQLATLGYQSPAIMAEQNVSNIKIVAGAFVGGQNLIVRKGVQVNSWKDLEGKKIGAPPGTYVSILFVLAARQHGVDLSKVSMINTTPAGPAELRALKSGDLDGLLLWSPVIDRAVVEGIAYYPKCCDIGSTKLYGPGNQILGANAAFLKDHDTALKFMKAYVEAEEYFSKNSDKAIDIIKQYTGVTSDVLKEALRHSHWDYRVDEQAAVNVAKRGPEFGFTKTDLSAKVPAFFDLSLLSQATGNPISALSHLGK